MIDSFIGEKKFHSPISAIFGSILHLSMLTSLGLLGILGRQSDNSAPNETKAKFT